MSMGGLTKNHQQPPVSLGCEFSRGAGGLATGNGLRRVTFLLVQKSNQKIHKGALPLCTPGLANSLRLEQRSPKDGDVLWQNA